MSIFQLRTLSLVLVAMAVVVFSRHALSASVAVRVSSSTDDAEEQLSDNTIDLGSSDLELAEEGAGDFQNIGIRFVGVLIQPGDVVEVSDAAIQFAVDEADAVDTSLRIFGELSLDPLTYTGTVGDISSRGRTTSFVDWNNIPAWSDADAAANLTGPNQRTPDLSAIIQEIIGQPGWVAGNAMAFIIEGNPGGERTAESFDGAAAVAPLLEIEFDLRGGGVFGDANGDGLVDILDFEVIRDNIYMGTTLAQGDINLSGLVDFVDFREWKAIAFPAGGGPAAVPEPGAISLIVIAAALAGFLSRRRRERR